MRPRFANRGSSVDSGIVDLPAIASMRPRFANRGSGSDSQEVPGQASGFNEAPIRESGK